MNNECRCGRVFPTLNQLQQHIKNTREFGDHAPSPPMNNLEDEVGEILYEAVLDYKPAHTAENLKPYTDKITHLIEQQVLEARVDELRFVSDWFQNGMALGELTPAHQKELNKHILELKSLKERG